MPGRAVFKGVLGVFVEIHPHLRGLAAGCVLDGGDPLGAARDVEDGLELIQVLLRDAAQRAGPLALVVGAEPAEDFVLVLDDPARDGPGLRVVVGVEGAGVDAVAEAQEYGMPAWLYG